MKRILIILLVISSVSKAQTPNYEPQSATYNTMADLKLSNADNGATAHVSGFYTPFDGGGGDFRRDATSTADTVTGMIVQTTGITTGRWIRQFTSDINLRWLGAKGIGIAGYKADSAALYQVIYNWAWTHNGAKVHVPKTDSFYCWAGLGFLAPDNFYIYGDGIGKTRMKYINMNFAPAYLNGTFLFLGTFSTDSAHNMSRTPRYQVYDIPKNQTFFKLRNISDASAFHVGEVIKLSSRAYNKGFNPLKPGKTIWRGNSFALVTGISNDTVSLNESASMDIYRDDPTYALYEVANGITFPTDTGSAMIFRPNAGTTINRDLNLPDHISKNVTVEDISFEVSPYDFVNNTPYDSTINKNPGNIFSNGCAYNVYLHNLELKAYGNLGGQYYSNFKWENIFVESARKLFDFGNESSEGSIKNVYWSYRNDFYDTSQSAMLYFNNYCHDIVIDGVYAKGNWNVGNIIQISSGIHDAIFKNINMYLPSYRNLTADAIHIVGDDTLRGTYPENLTFNNIRIELDTVNRFISYVNPNHTIPKLNRDINFNNIVFRGTAVDAKATFFRYADSVYYQNVQLSSPDSVHIFGVTTIKNRSFLSSQEIPATMTAKTCDSCTLTSTNYIDLYPHSVGTTPATGHIYFYGNTNSFVAFKNDANKVMAFKLDNLTAAITTFTMPTVSGIPIITINGVPPSTAGDATITGLATPNSLTINASGSGAASPATFNGGAAVTISDNTLGATTVGHNLFQLTNPSVISFLRINADNSVTTRGASGFKTDLNLNLVENTALSTWAGSANLITLGTIATGVWNGTALTSTYLPSVTVYNNQANTFGAGFKQTFTSNGTNSGLGFAGVTADPSVLVTGDAWYRSDLSKFKYYDGTTARFLVSEALAQTLTNKTIDAASNTISNIANANIAAAAAIDVSKLSTNIRPSTTSLGSLQTTTVTTMGNVSGMTIAIAASTKYHLHIVMGLTCTTANGVKVGISIGGSATLQVGNYLGNNGSGTALRYLPITAIDGTNIGAMNQFNGTGTATMDLYFTSSSAVTAQVTMGSVTNGDTSTMGAGSTIELTPVQ